MTGDTFEILGAVQDVEVIAVGSAIRDLERLRRLHGRGRWRKMKGWATIRTFMETYGRRRFTGMKHTASGNGASRSKSRSTRWPRFVLCLENSGNEVSLEVGKVYCQIKPHKNDMPNWIRVVDESGEDYLFPAKRFVPIELPARAKRVVATSVG